MPAARLRRNDNIQFLREHGALPVKRRIVVSNKVITNRGPDTSVDAALMLIKMLNGKEGEKHLDVLNAAAFKQLFNQPQVGPDLNWFL